MVGAWYMEVAVLEGSGPRAAIHMGFAPTFHLLSEPGKNPIYTSQGAESHKPSPSWQILEGAG